MGNSNSSEKQRIQRTILHKNAVNLYNQRIQNYNHAYHGSYSTYLRNVKAQFQLDCLPDYVKYGSNYVATDNDNKN